MKFILSFLHKEYMLWCLCVCLNVCVLVCVCDNFIPCQFSWDESFVINSDAQVHLVLASSFLAGFQLHSSRGRVRPEEEVGSDGIL